MEPNFITYKKFNDKDAATEFILLLEDNKIGYKLEEQSLEFNPPFDLVKTDTIQVYLVKIRSEDFDRVNYLLRVDDNFSIFYISIAVLVVLVLFRLMGFHGHH